MHSRKAVKEQYGLVPHYQILDKRRYETLTSARRSHDRETDQPTDQAHQHRGASQSIG